MKRDVLTPDFDRAGRLTIYVPSPLRKKVREADEFLRTYPNLSISGVLLTAFQVCWPTMKQHIPKDRTFKLNGVEVIV